MSTSHVAIAADNLFGVGHAGLLDDLSTRNFKTGKTTRFRQFLLSSQHCDGQLQALRGWTAIIAAKSEPVKMAADVAVSIVLSWSAAACVPFKGPSTDRRVEVFRSRAETSTHDANAIDANDASAVSVFFLFSELIFSSQL